MGYIIDGQDGKEKSQTSWPKARAPKDRRLMGRCRQEGVEHKAAKTQEEAEGD
jgi:hypothetical protein